MARELEALSPLWLRQERSRSTEAAARPAGNGSTTRPLRLHADSVRATSSEVNSRQGTQNNKMHTQSSNEPNNQIPQILNLYLLSADHFREDVHPPDWSPKAKKVLAHTLQSPRYKCRLLKEQEASAEMERRSTPTLGFLIGGLSMKLMPSREFRPSMKPRWMRRAEGAGAND